VWLGWALAGAIGWGVGFFLALAPEMWAEGSLAGAPPAPAPEEVPPTAVGSAYASSSGRYGYASYYEELYAVLPGPLNGAVVGAAQWLVLRRRLRGAWWLVPANAAAFGILQFADLAGILLVGPLIAGAQWLALWRSGLGDIERVAWSGWWLLASALAGIFCWNLGFDLGIGWSEAAVEGQQTYTALQFAVPNALGAAVGGGLYGAITGPFLARLLREAPRLE
jgi:hypothetical protein